MNVDESDFVKNLQINELISFLNKNEQIKNIGLQFTFETLSKFT